LGLIFHPPAPLSFPDAGAKLDLRDGSGQLPLHVCCHAGSEHIMRLLLLAGADPRPTWPARNGKPPHELALSKGHMAVYRMLTDPRIDADPAAVAEGLGRESLSHDSGPRRPAEDRVLKQLKVEEAISDAAAMVAEMLDLGPGPPDRSENKRSRSPRPRSPRSAPLTGRVGSPRRRRAPR
jgi:ankyrin repeat protein